MDSRTSAWLLAASALPVALAVAGAGAASAETVPAPTVPGQVRAGDFRADLPGMLDKEQTRQLDDAAAGVESQLVTVYQSAGLDPTRSRRAAAATVGDAMIGAGIGLAVGAPIIASAGVVGGVAGLVDQREMGQGAPSATADR